MAHSHGILNSVDEFPCSIFKNNDPLVLGVPWIVSTMARNGSPKNVSLMFDTSVNVDISTSSRDLNIYTFF